MKTLWMVVSQDEYELPEYVADSAKEIADKYHTTSGSVTSTAYKMAAGVIKNGRYVRVKVEDIWTEDS